MNAVAVVLGSLRALGEDRFKRRVFNLPAMRKFPIERGDLNFLFSSDWKQVAGSHML